MKKKSNAIAYHFVPEGVARDEWRTAYLNTDENVADLLTNPLSGPKQAKFVQMILHHVFPEGDGELGEIKSFLLPTRIGTSSLLTHTL